MIIKLIGGPCDGMKISHRDADTDHPILMPTNRDAAQGYSKPTAPHFSEYRFTGKVTMSQGWSTWPTTNAPGVHEFRYVGDGMNVEYEVIDDDPSAAVLALSSCTRRS